METPFAAIGRYNVGGTTSYSLGTSVNNGTDASVAAAVALATASDVVVLVVGIDLTVEAEGKDRTAIDLPSVQHDLIARVTAVGKPTVLVLINGGMVAVEPEAQMPLAIIEAFYPGQYGADAIAATLFGKNDRLGGKMPYTVYPAGYVDQMPMTEMEMDMGLGRTYRCV